MDLPKRRLSDSSGGNSSAGQDDDTRTKQQRQSHGNNHSNNHSSAAQKKKNLRKRTRQGTASGKEQEYDQHTHKQHHSPKQHQNHHRNSSMDSAHGNVSFSNLQLLLKIDPTQPSGSEQFLVDDELSVSLGHDDLNQDPEISSSDSTLHSTHSVSGDTQTAAASLPAFAQSEAQKVNRWEIFAMFIFLVNAILVIATTFTFLNREEIETFEGAVSILIKLIVWSTWVVPVIVQII